MKPVLTYSLLYRIFKLPRILNPIFQIGQLINSMYSSAVGELEDSQNLTDYVNPFSISSSDSYESFTDSSFDSYESDSSQNSFHSGEEGPPRKPLPEPPEKKKKVLLFMPNSCSLIGQVHITCDSINNAIGSEQLILCRSKFRLTDLFFFAKITRTLFTE